MGENRNLIIAFIVLMIFMFVYQTFVLDPMAKKRQEQLELDQARQQSSSDESGPVAAKDPFGQAGEQTLTREQAVAQDQRIPIRTEALSGSISINGARFDDLQLLRYDTEVDSDDPVTLLNPQGSPGGHFTVNGWLGGQGAPANLPGLNTQWQLVQGSVLTPDSSIVLQYTTGDLTFNRTISVDDNYLFTLTDTVTNTGTGTQMLRPYGLVRQEGLPTDLSDFFILHEGTVGVVGDEMIKRKYNKLTEETLLEDEGLGGWMGITSKYWLAAVSPQGTPDMRAQFRMLGSPDQPVFEANYLLNQDISIAPGARVEQVSFVYAGAKSQSILASYEDTKGIPRLTMAIDWGMFWFLTRPFFAALHFFHGYLGNYALAIMLLTLLIKLVLFPLNNRAFASMAKMKVFTPKMTEIKERHKDNPQALQQAMADLYRKEKINPLAGCLPILPQIPIFFALYKTVYISLDARHEPFLWWISDMSAADPTSFWNLFGLLPYDPYTWGILEWPLIGGIMTALIALGLLPIIMGITMWAQQSLNPPPPDKIQRQIFAALPIVFTLVMARFPAALLIYWSWNNILTVAQQYYIMRRQGVQTELDKNVLRLRAKMAGAPVPVFEDPHAPKADESKKTISDKSADDSNKTDPQDNGDDTKPTPTPKPGRRVKSNPAAKKRRTTPKKKPGK